MIKLEVIDIAINGDKIAKDNLGKVYFLKSNKIQIGNIVYINEENQDILKVEITEKNILPKCFKNNICNNCPLMPIKYIHQLELKQNIVKQALKKQGKLNKEELDNLKLTIVSDENIFKYRNKIELTYDNQKNICGYVVNQIDNVKNIENNIQKNTEKNNFNKQIYKQILKIDECILAKDNINKIIKNIYEIISEVLTKQEISKLKRIMIRENYLGEIDINFKLDKKINQKLDKKTYAKLDEKIQIKLLKNNIHRISINDEIKYILNKEYEFKMKISNYLFKLDTSNFFQVNDFMTYRLYNEIVKKMLTIDNYKDKKVLELYSGVGTITIYLAKYVKNILGIEINQRAEQLSKENAKINEITNVDFKSGDAKKLIDKYINDYDILIVDPPRKGISKQEISQILNYNIQNIIYVSCNPVTLARDISYLKEHYTLDNNISIIDMFPNTNHVESVVLLSRKSS